METVDNRTLAILGGASIDKEACSLTINEELERSEYKKVDNLLQRLRGKWNRSAGAHIFPFDPSGPVNEVIRTKEMPPKNPFAFFPTPDSAIQVMFDLSDNICFEWADEERPLRILEPSAGIGGIADFLRSKTPHMHLDVIEIAPANQEILRSKGYEPYCMDFLEFPVPEEDKLYDMVFVNPPFTIEKNRFVFKDHIRHALKMLKPTGELIAIVPPGWTTNQTKKDEEFRNLVSSLGNHIDTLEAGTFKDSGTMIETKVIVFYAKEWKHRETCGFASHYEREFFLYASQEYEFQKVYDKLLTNKNTTDAQLETFARDLINEYAKRDIFLSTEYIPQYVQRMRREHADEHEETVEIKEVIEVATEEVDVSLVEKQKQIAQAGGNLLDLMSA